MSTKKFFLAGLTVLMAFALTVQWGCQTKEVTSAKVYISQNDWDNAIAQLEAAVATTPENAEAQYLLGRGYGVKGRFEEMNRAFEASLAADPKFENQIKFEREKYWIDAFNKGVQAFNQKDLPAAISAFEQARQIDPERVETYRNLAVGYLGTKQYDKAVETYQKALDIEPEDVETLVNFGIAYYNHGDFENAVKMFNRALELDPSNANAISMIGLAYDQTGNTEKAMAAYESALQNSPDNMDIVFNYARLFYNKEQYDKAIEQFERILEKNPDDFDALLSAGDSYLRVADRYRMQAKELEDKNADDPKVAELRAKAKENYKLCLPYLEKARDIKPDNRNLWYNLGIAYIQTGDGEKGKEAFAKAEELEKKN